MLNSIPFVGWLASLLVSVSLSIPFWICWTVCGIGQKYGYFLPAPYQSIPFWDCVGLFISIGIIGMMVGILTPKISSVSQTNEKKT